MASHYSNRTLQTDHSTDHSEGMGKLSEWRPNSQLRVSEYEDTLGGDMVRISIQSTALIAIFMASIIANSFVFVVFYRKPALLSNSYRFVLNLAVCNCLMAVLVTPFVLVSTFTIDWVLGWGSCQVVGMTTTLLFVASILTLMLIAMDRYYAIMKPLHYHLTLLSKRSPLCICGVWVVSTVIAVPPMIGWNHFSYQPGKAMCTVTWRAENATDRAYSFSFVLLCFVIPYFVMLWVYICAFRTAQRTSARARRNSVTPEHGMPAASDVQTLTQKMLNRERRRSSAASLIHAARRRSSSSVTRTLLAFHRDDWKAAKTSLTVMSAFTVCWLPFFILISMEAILGSRLQEGVALWTEGGGHNVKVVIPYWLEGGAICLALAGCALNPLVYVFRSEQIKQELRKLFCPGSAERHLDHDGSASQGVRSSLPRRDSPPPPVTIGHTAPAQTTTAIRASPCSSNGTLAPPVAATLTKLSGAAAVVVTFSDDPKHKDGVSL